MSLSRSFKETVKARAARDPAFRAALLGEAVEAFAAGEADTGKALICDYINAFKTRESILPGRLLHFSRATQ